MSITSPPLKEKLTEYLDRVAERSVIDQGNDLVRTSAVSECFRDGAKIVGHVRDTNGNTFSACLYVLSPDQIDPSCTCEEGKLGGANKRWCCHGVALFISAAELGIFEILGGFDAPESLLRPYVSSPKEVALTIKELLDANVSHGEMPSNEETVSIYLSIMHGGLVIQPYLGTEIFVPQLFEQQSNELTRKLDAVLLEKISADGIWDEDHSYWLVNGAHSISTILGLLKEYATVYWLNPTKKQKKLEKVVFEEKPLDARLSVDWSEDDVMLSMIWIDPQAKELTKQPELLGSGPHWARVDSKIYRVTPQASRITSLFPHDTPLAIPKHKAAPLVEILSDYGDNSQHVSVANRKLMPKPEVVDPKMVLDLRLQSSGTGSSIIEVISVLDFQYPEPGPKENKVFLPNRNKESEAFAILEQAGFSFDPTTRRYRIQDDKALDLIDAGEKIFPTDWTVQGFKEIRKGIKFADLSLNVSVTESTASDWSNDDTDWFDCHVVLTQNNSAIPLSALFKHETAQTDRWIQLDNGSYARVPGESLIELKSILGTINTSFWMSNNLRTKLSSSQTIGLGLLDKTERINLNTSSEVKKIMKKIENFKEIESIPVPKKFLGKLRSYQKEGLAWLNFLNEFGFGGILADEMGLGKTVQTLAFLQHLKTQGKKKPTLIVVPTSIITNWQYEAARFTPDLKVLVLHGPERKNKLKHISDYDIVITSYALMRLDYRELGRHHYAYLILDEAQNIKNEQAATTKAAKAIRAQRRLALTGTPTENRPMELWSIMDFLMPGYLGTNDFFKKNFENPIMEKGPSHKAAVHLRNKVRPFLLKRRKADVEKDLPPKVESVIHVNMTPAQQAIYLEMLADIRPRVMGEIAEKGVGGASISILAALLRLRQICNHPQSIEAFRGFEDLTSGKFLALQEIIQEALDSNRKILLYSQFVTMLDIIRKWIDKDTDIPYLYLDGRTKNRQDLVDRFNTDESVRLFLISLKAGGTGLNLTGADTVIIYDPWWNPAVEDQAADRAHRIGQTKAVTVYRLVTENSIERRIMDLKAKKAKLVDALLNDQGISTLKLSKNDIESLFAPPEPLTSQDEN